LAHDEGRSPFNILKSTKLGDLQQTTVNDIQKATFIENSDSIRKNWNEQVTIKQAQLATKTFGYGLPGPHSFSVETTAVDATGIILQPDDNEVLQIINLSVQESAGSTAAGNLTITNGSQVSYLWFDSSVSANQVDVVQWSGDLFLTKDAYLKLTVGSGAFNIGVTYSKVVY